MFFFFVIFTLPGFEEGEGFVGADFDEEREEREEREGKGVREEGDGERGENTEDEEENHRSLSVHHLRRRDRHGDRRGSDGELTREGLYYKKK